MGELINVQEQQRRRKVVDAGRDSNAMEDGRSSLQAGIDCAQPTGRMLAGIFAALAGYERELMHELAVAATRGATRLRGRRSRRPSKLSETQIRQVRAQQESGELISSPVRSFGVSRASIYRVLQSAELIALDLPSDAVAEAVVS